MLHSIDRQELTRRLGEDNAETVADGMLRAIAGCVHCGFCLPACPTYGELGEELDSPRGRIFLMKEGLEGRIPLLQTAEYVDRCLGCLACEPACPSGVSYRHLVQPYRALLAAEGGWGWRRAVQRATHWTLSRPRLLRWALRLASVTRPLRGLAPRALRPLFEVAAFAGDLPAAETLPTTTPAEGRRRARVALLSGCVQQVLAPSINGATVRVLARNGVEVVVPGHQVCCGSLHLHDGDLKGARRRMERNLKAFPTDVDAVIINAAGCGSGLREIDHLLPGDASREFASKVRDVSAFLVELGIAEVPPLPLPTVAAYQDACHLRQAQGIVAQPRRLLASIPGLELRELPTETCCGSAGTYNLTQPELADALGRRKAQEVLASGCDVLVSGNIGCIVQLRGHLNRLGAAVPVLHTVELLDRAYRRDGNGRAAA